MDRRRFIMGSAAAVGAASNVLGAPGDTVRVGVLGVGGQGEHLGGRGKDHLTGFGKLPNVEVAAVCDVDQRHLDYGVDLVAKQGGKKPQGYTDYRKILDDTSGQTSTQNPQYTHRPKSRMNSAGYFSILGSGCSAAVISMHLAGQTVSHIIQATQRGEPSSRFVSL